MAEIDLHETQSIVFKDLMVDNVCQYSAVCCSRGWGKSYLGASAGVSAVSELLTLPKSIPNKFVYIVAPTFDQVMDIYHPILAYDFDLESHCKINKGLGRFTFPNASEIRLLSYEAVQRMRGKGSYFTVWDEVSSCESGTSPKEAWESVILPSMNTRWSTKRVKELNEKYGDLLHKPLSPARLLGISTPKGYNFFHHLFSLSELNENYKSYHYDYLQSPYLDPEDIEKARNDMDPITFATEYLALFKESGYAVFYMFDRKSHVMHSLEDFSEEEDVHVAIDFNVAVQASAVFAVRAGQIHILEQLKGHADTETLAKALKEKYGKHRIFAYPDPSGRARKTSAPVGRTDFSILESYGIRCLARTAAPPIVDSVQAVNRMLKSANDQIRLYVHPRCADVITSLERTKWADKNKDSATIDKSEGVEHFSDGIRYAVEYIFPVVAGTKRTARGFKF
jgi:hypothetical protein